MALNLQKLEQQLDKDCDVDYSQMSDNELLKIWFKLMRASVKNLLNNDAKEHQEYERYMIELERRQINIT